MAETPAETDRQTNSAAAPSTGRISARGHVLVADDDRSIRMLIAKILSKAGYSVTQAETGAQVIPLMNSKRADLVLLDIEMPGMDGLQTLRVLKRNPSTQHIPVMMLSAHLSGTYVKECVDLGADDFIVKQSMQPQRLVERIHRAMQAKASEAKPTPQPEELANEPAIDQAAWTRKMADIGRSNTEVTRESLNATSIPMIFPAICDEVCLIANAQPADDLKLTLAIEQEPAIILPLMKAAGLFQTHTNKKTLDVKTLVGQLRQADIASLSRGVLSQYEAASGGLRSWMLRWWRHALAVSRIAAELAPAVGLSPATARTAGMIHDIGRLLLLRSEFGAKVVSVYDLARNMIIPTVYAEQTLLGMNHKQIGLELCRRYAVPEELANICETHDYDDEQRERLDEDSRTLSAVVCAANTLAKATGYGSLPNDELPPLPRIMAEPATQARDQIDDALAETANLFQQRIASESIDVSWPVVTLSNIRITFIRPSTSGYAYLQALEKAGATATISTDIESAALSSSQHDVAVLDYTDTNVAPVAATLEAMTQGSPMSRIPMLLLARRSDDAEDLLEEIELPIHVYATPIRVNSLLQSVVRLSQDKQG